MRAEKSSENKANKEEKQKEAALIKWWIGIVTLKDWRISIIVNS